MATRKKDPEGEVALIKPETDLVFISDNPEGMREYQTGIRNALQARIVELDKTIEELTAEVERLGVERKSIVILDRALVTLNRQRAYYRKGCAALDAGYFLFPNFPMHVIAMRVKRGTEDDVHKDARELKEVLEGDKASITERVEALAEKAVMVLDRLVGGSPPTGRAPHEGDQLPVGEGAWQPAEEEDGNSHVTGILVGVRRRTPVEAGSMLVPMEFCHTQIIKAATRAEAEKIFDEIGIFPDDRHPGTPATGDPVLLGRLRADDRTMTFLITSHVDLSTL